MAALDLAGQLLDVHLLDERLRPLAALLAETHDVTVAAATDIFTGADTRWVRDTFVGAEDRLW
jgi:hypothetical protein